MSKRILLIDSDETFAQGLSNAITARGFTGTEVGASLDVMVPLCAEKILHGDTTILDADPAAGDRRPGGRTRWPRRTGLDCGRNLRTMTLRSEDN